MAKKIVVSLLSGGIDSCIATAIKASEPNTQVHLLSIYYGQGAEESEKKQSALVADKLAELYPNIVEHFYLTINGQARWNKLINLRDSQNQIRGFVGWRTPSGGWYKSGYPSTRDEAFTLMAAAGLEARLAQDKEADKGEVVLATIKEDLGNFEDIEPVVYENYLNEVLKRKMVPRMGKQMRIVLPLINMMKYQVIQRGIEIGAPLELTWSCYFGEPGMPCGKCDQCNWRAEAFKRIGMEDTYQGVI